MRADTVASVMSVILLISVCLFGYWLLFKCPHIPTDKELCGNVGGIVVNYGRSGSTLCEDSKHYILFKLR